MTAVTPLPGRELVAKGAETMSRVLDQARSLAESSEGWLGRRLADTVTPDTRHKIERLLQELGCQLAQGYLYGAAMPLAAATHWLERHAGIELH